jgi:hypothetical protein
MLWSLSRAVGHPKETHAAQQEARPKPNASHSRLT